MKKNAQITLIIIAISFGLIEILFLGESFKAEKNAFFWYCNRALYIKHLLEQKGQELFG